MKFRIRVGLGLAAALFIPAAGFAQPPALTVRLFSVHAPERLLLSAGSGGFHFKKCVACKDSPKTAQLVLHAVEEHLAVSLAPHGALTRGPGLAVAANALGQKKTTARATNRAHLSPSAGIRFETPGDGAVTEFNSAVLQVTGSYRLAVPAAAGEQLSGSPMMGPGDLKFPLTLTAHQGRIIATVKIPVEDYVQATVAGESLPSDPNESLKAMAVVARTFAARFRPRHSAWHVDFCDSTHCQKLSFTKQSARIQAALQATAGEMLWHQGRPASTYYHQNCGGTVAAAGEVWPDEARPYLHQHPDPYCLRASGGWTTNIKKLDLQKALLESGIRVPRDLQSLAIASKTPSGRVQHLRLVGATGASEELQASSLRFAVGRTLGWNLIKSDLYDIRDGGSEIYLQGRGSGHGVGLCQVGATQMAKEGKTYRDILNFYYAGAKLGVSAQGIDWQTLRNERVEVLTTQPDRDSSLMDSASRLLIDSEARTGLHLKERPQIKIYPTVEVFRDATGEPGWVAASTRGQIIRLQPLATLRARGIVESTLRHEFVHQLVEANASASLPLWFREGLAGFLAGENAGEPALRGAKELTKLDMAGIDEKISHRGDAAAMRGAYTAARREIGELVEIYGRSEVLSWLTRGIPVAVIARILNEGRHPRGDGVAGAKDVTRQGERQHP